MPIDRVPFHILDELMAHADGPVEPFTVQIEARMRSRLDETRAHEAVLSAIAAHPLTRARLEPWIDAESGYDWLIDPEPQIDPFRTLESDDDLDAIRSTFLSRPLSLFESPPLRVLHVRGQDSDSLMISMHHAASDGMGARRFLQSILRRYAGLDDPVPDIQPEDARSRAVPSGRPSAAEFLKAGKVELQRLTRSGPRTSRLSPRGDTQRPGYGVCTLPGVPLGPIVSSPLRKEVGATVNDVLVAAASRAAARWIDGRGDAASGISVTMPINARPAEWSTEVVANLVTSESVSTRSAERASARSCLTAVAGFTDAVKQRGPGMAMSALSRVPRRGVGARRTAIRTASLIGSGNPFGTMALSNLGRIPEDWLGADAPEVDAVHFSPPTPMPSGLGLGAAAIGDELTLTLRHRWTLWSSDAADQFARMLEAELDEIADH